MNQTSIEYNKKQKIGEKVKAMQENLNKILVENFGYIDTN